MITMKSRNRHTLAVLLVCAVVGCSSSQDESQSKPPTDDQPRSGSSTEAMTVSRADQADVIAVVDTTTGCFHDEEANHEFRRDGESYVWVQQTVSTEQVKRLRRLILEAPKDQAKVLSSLGITPQKVASKRDTILTAALRQWRYQNDDLPELPATLENVLSFEFLAPILLEQVSGEVQESTTFVEFSVTLPGDPPIKVSSHAERPGMLPFTVTIGEKEWRIYSPDVSKALQRLASPSGPNYKLLDGRQYWSDAGWVDPEEFIDILAERIDHHFSTKMYKQMDGFSDVKETFKVENAYSAWRLQVNLNISVLNRKAIDSIWCSVHLSDDRQPKSSWNDIFNLHEAADALAAEHKWLVEWRKGGENRSVELQISGNRELRRGFLQDDDPDVVWKDAGLAGRPEFLIYLRQADSRVRCNVYLNQQETAAMITEHRQGKGDHWLDKISIPDESVAVVNRSGEVLKVQKLPRKLDGFFW